MNIERAYPKVYLNDFRNHMAKMFTIAMCIRGYRPLDFQRAFLDSDLPDHIERGHPRYIGGSNCEDLIYTIFYDTGYELETIPEEVRPWFSELGMVSEYHWVGYILTTYQWGSNMTFRDILNCVSIEDIHNMYYPIHEAPIEVGLGLIDERIKMKYGKEVGLHDLE